MVAQVRGVVLKPMWEFDGAHVESTTQRGQTKLNRALEDVSRWLGFANSGDYCTALRARGRRIFRRVK